jgi:hypothetical protein
MNNKPVAWGWYDLEIKRFFPHWDEDLMENKEGCIPLYTHPVKTLTVTLDDCVKAELEQDVGYGGDLDLLEFAKAILRKAQEK